jgi:hypothetical protein
VTSHKGAFVGHAHAHCRSRPAHAQGRVPKSVSKTTSHGRGPRLSCGSQIKVPVPSQQHQSRHSHQKQQSPTDTSSARPLKSKQATLPLGSRRRTSTARLSYVWYVCAVERAYRISRLGSLSPVICCLACDRAKGMGRAQRPPGLRCRRTNRHSPARLRDSAG